MTHQHLDSDYMSAAQVAKIIGVNRATVINWAKQGRIEGVQYGEGGVYRFLRSDIHRFMADSRLVPLHKHVDETD